MTESPTWTTQVGTRHWHLTTVAGMASYLDAGVIVSVGLSLAIWSRELGLSAGSLGIISAELTLSIAVGSLIGGRLADVFGRRRVFNLDLLIYVLGVTLIAASVNEAMLLTGVVIAGLAAGADLPTSIAVVAEIAPPHARGRLVAFTQVMWGAGIAAVTALGFAVSTMGLLGVRLLFLHLAVLGASTWAVRVFSPLLRELETQAVQRPPETNTPSGPALPLRALFGSTQFVAAMAMTTGFYVAWGLMANTWGQFKTFFLTTVSGATQSSATAWSFVAILSSLAMGMIFVRIVDTRWRNPLFYVGAAGQIAAMVLGAVTRGETFWAMILVLAVVNLTYPFAGEAIYKVWTQERFPANARATAQGFTTAFARFIFAGFAVVTPTIIASSPSGLLWILAGCATVSALIGSLAVRSHVPSPEVTDPQEPPEMTRRHIDSAIVE